MSTVAINVLVNSSSRNELIVGHLSLVRSVAASVAKSVPVHLDHDDLVHSGIKGLIVAATRYQTDRDTSFVTYAKHRIRGAILDSLRQADVASRELRASYKKAQLTRDRLRCQLDREPTDLEMARAMNLDIRRWRSLTVSFRYLAASAPPRNKREEQEQNKRELPCAPSSRPDHSYALAATRQRLESILGMLPRRHQQVVIFYYRNQLTMKEVGTLLGINESRVSQIHKSALARMRKILLTGGIASASALAA